MIGRSALAGWFDLNGATAGFGLTADATNNWWAANVWNATATGDGAVSTWVNGSTQAYFVGSGVWNATRDSVHFSGSGSLVVLVGNATRISFF